MSDIEYGLDSRLLDGLPILIPDAYFAKLLLLLLVGELLVISYRLGGIGIELIVRKPIAGAHDFVLGHSQGDYHSAQLVTVAGGLLASAHGGNAVVRDSAGGINSAQSAVNEHKVRIVVLLAADYLLHVVGIIGGELLAAALVGLETRDIGVSGHIDYISLSAAVVGDEAKSREIVNSVENAALVVDIIRAEMIESRLIHLTGLHISARLDYSISGLFKEEIHILRVGAGGIFALAAIGDADVFRKLDEEGIPKTLRVDAAVAMSSKNIDGNYILALELFCHAVAYLLDVLARNADALDSRENDLAASVVKHDCANLHVVEHGLDSVRREVLEQVARQIIVAVENIVGHKARLAVAELPLRVL